MALHIGGYEGTMGNSDHCTTYTYTAITRLGGGLGRAGGERNVTTQSALER